MNKVIKFNLGGTWLLSSEKIAKPIKATVPGSVYNDLLKENLIPDPFFQDNEYLVREYMNYDYSYEREFEVSFQNRRNFLVCNGLDTLADIYLNDFLIASTDNMHRTYRFELGEQLKNGLNKIKIVFKSCLKYIANEKAACKIELFQASDAVAGYPHLRKGSSMFGWDWGPQLPDAGIWRSIFIESINDASLENVFITQNHYDDFVELNVETKVRFATSSTDLLKKVIITDDLGELVNETISHIENSNIIKIANPKKWYPVNLGLQPLYQVTVSLLQEGEVIDEITHKIGLRTIKLIKEADQFGESFFFRVNGIDVFSKGANYIPEDNLLARTNYDLTKDLLVSAKLANHNMVRVWGGGIYPPDYFYDLCDELGLLVWQDLMFACSAYDVDNPVFLETMKQEIIDNIIRIRNHPSIALICGNNENETAIECWNVPHKEKAKKLYIKHYVTVLADIVKEYYPNMDYWRSSPSSKELFKDTNSDDYGDMHYWGVWHANEPITYYRHHYPRFMSEFGLQSFPTLKTIKTFAEEKDLNIFSYVMEQHQKNKTSNSKILNYVGKMFQYPQDFESLLYVSQIIQAEGIRYGVEHWRRNLGRCMGILYWQLNDCWPVASWSSIDYFHRWKVLHYHSKKFYQPVLVSIEEEDSKANIYITNDSLEHLSGELSWELLDLEGNILQADHLAVEVLKQSSTKFIKLNFALTKTQAMDKVLYVKFLDNKDLTYTNEVSFVPDKYIHFKKPNITTALNKTETGYQIELTTDQYAKFVELSFKDLDIRFSDNYFNLIPNYSKTIEIITQEDLLLGDLEIKSLIDSF
ncbi:MAG: glycoside hydrolase family 2 protein [Tenericutes bacterium]|nr:glycoside hydrolase family 2 protein [Mycoplasmatota bacterium]